jgi:hypothetical protein
MSIEWVLYLIDVTSKIPPVTMCVAFCFFTLSIIIHACNEADGEKDGILTHLFFMSSIFLFILGIVSCVFVPSKQTMYAIAFTHYSKQSEIPAKVLKAIEVKLDEVIEGAKK